MKKIITIILAIVCIAALTTVCFVGCSSSSKPIIGIIQFGTHGSLNNCYEGILQGLKEGGINLDDYTIEYVNSNFTAEVSGTQAQKLVNEKAKVIIAIATPSAIQAATAASGTGIPVVYDAVTDVSTVKSFENITGVCDLCPFADTLSLAVAMLNKTDLKIGVLMSTEEDSDQMQLASLKEAAKAYSGMSIVDKTVADITTITTATTSLLNEGVDCLVNLLDNTIVGKLNEILSITNEKGIPVFGSEIEQVKNGCLAAASIDYITVGKLAGLQAASILKGTPISDVKAQTMEGNSTPYYNSEAATKLNITVPTYTGLTDVKA